MGMCTRYNVEDIRFYLSAILPYVISLHLHLENYQSMSFNEDQMLEDIVTNERASKTMLMEFFQMNQTKELKTRTVCTRNFSNILSGMRSIEFGRIGNAVKS